MCEKCIETTSKETEQTQEDEVVYQPFIMLPFDNLMDVQYDDVQFQNGVSIASETCGMISALMSAGFTSAECLEYIINEKTISHNLTLAKLNNEASIKIAEISDVKVQQASI